MKTVERMTNPCFLNTEFAKLMKGKHVMHTWEETLLNSVREVSSEKENVNDEENEEFNAGSENGSVNDEVYQSDPIENLLSQATQSSLPQANLFFQTTEKQNLTTGKNTRQRRATPDNQNIRRGKRLRTKTARFAPSSRTTVRIRQ